MADLTSLEKQKLENLLKMKQGFLLNFTVASLNAFVLRSVGIDLDQEKYRNGTGSKANRMREFWKLEPDLIVAKLIFDLCQYFLRLKEKKGEALTPEEQILLDDCVNVSKKLSGSVEVVGVLVKRNKTKSPVPDKGAVMVNTMDSFAGFSTATQVRGVENETVFLVTDQNIMPFLATMR